jgi:signal transduction histidine kinase
VESLRAYIFELRSNRGRRQLDERLQELVSRMGSAYPAAVTLEIGFAGLEDQRLEEEVYKIVTEALSNAFRHSGASNIEVAVQSDDDFCSVIVRDDGEGFDPAEVSGGMGLTNLTTRAQGRGGTVGITSDSSTGTTVEVKLPIR